MFPKRFLVISVGLVCLSHYPSTAGAQVFITSWGTYGSGSGQFRTPQGVAVGGSGDVYIVDGDNLRVQVFSSGGSFLRMWPAVGANIAVDASDNVYVGAFQNMIRKFTRTGTLLTEWDNSFHSRRSTPSSQVCAARTHGRGAGKLVPALSKRPQP